MRSPVIRMAALAAAAAGCCTQAFLIPTPGAALSGTHPCASSRHSVAVATRPENPHSRRGHQHRGSSLSRHRSGVLRMSSDEGESESEAKKEDEGEPAAEAAGPVVPSVNDMMENAKEADFLARAQASSVVGPAMQPEEERKEEMLKAKELEPKTNPWASGAFKRGLALQGLVLSLVIFLQFQPPEVANLAICAPFTHPGGCATFGEWIDVVFFGAPIPPM